MTDLTAKLWQTGIPELAENDEVIEWKARKTREQNAEDSEETEETEEA